MSLFKPIYLVKNENATFDLDELTASPNYVGTLISSDVKSWKTLPFSGEWYDPKQRKDLDDAIEKGCQSPSDSHLKLQVACSSPGTFLVLLNVEFISELVELFSNTLPNPEINITGEFCMEFEKGCFEYTAWSRNKYEFELKNIEIKPETQSFLTFYGSIELAALINSYVRDRDRKNGKLQFEFSIILDWVDGDSCCSGSSRGTKRKLGVLDALWEGVSGFDCVIVAANETEHSCHRLILEAASSVFRAMLASGCKESRTNRIVMKKNSEQAVVTFLAYIYEKNIKAKELGFEIAFELLQLADFYNISSLENVMIETLYIKPSDWFTADQAMELYSFVGNLEAETYNMLKTKMLHTLFNYRKELRSADSYNELLEKDPKQAAELLLKILEFQDN